MNKICSVIVGGSRGNGLEISKILKIRKDYVINISRSKSKYANKNISIDLLNTKYLETLKKNFKNVKIQNLIFSQRYRGNNPDEEINLMIKSSYEIINLFKDKFKNNGSVVFLSSTAINNIADQNEIYNLSQSARESLVKYFAVKFRKNSVRFNCVLPSRLIKSENKLFFQKNTKIKNLLKKINPMNRIPTSKDTAMLVEFLTSNNSKMINGTSIIVDGGLHLRGQEDLINEFFNKKIT